MKRKRKFKKLLIPMLVLIIISIYLTKENKTKNNNDSEIKNKVNNVKPNEEYIEPIKKIDYSKFITNEIEDNQNIIAEYISNGMSIKNFELSLSRITTYLEKTKEKYNIINYKYTLRCK